MDELEEEEIYIASICEAAKKHVPDYDVDAIFEAQITDCFRKLAA